ncbi:unnamed protein product [Amoebophrya sp. A120]|nr:unnamed protein product [Amoebophrya sp. A120]|eukprot:GSA120T00006604001.1
MVLRGRVVRPPYHASLAYRRRMRRRRRREEVPDPEEQEQAWLAALAAERSAERRKEQEKADLMLSKAYQERLEKEAAFARAEIEREGLLTVLEVTPPERFLDREFMAECIQKSSQVYWKFLPEELKRPPGIGDAAELKNFDPEADREGDQDVKFAVLALDQLLSNEVDQVSNKREIARLVHAMPDECLRIDAIRSKLRALAEAKKDVPTQWVEDRLELLEKPPEQSEGALQECAAYFKKFGACDALAFCSSELKSDKESLRKLLQMTAVDPNDPAAAVPDEKSGNFLEFARDGPRADFELCKVAVSSDPSAEPFAFAADALQLSKEFILHAVRRIDDGWAENHWNLIELAESADGRADSCSRTRECGWLKENVIENVLDVAAEQAQDGVARQAVLQDDDVQKAMLAIYYPSPSKTPACCLEWQAKNASTYEALKQNFEQRLEQVVAERKARQDAHNIAVRANGRAGPCCGLM